MNWRGSWVLQGAILGDSFSETFSPVAKPTHDLSIPQNLVQIDLHIEYGAVVRGFNENSLLLDVQVESVTSTGWRTDGVSGGFRQPQPGFLGVVQTYRQLCFTWFVMFCYLIIQVPSSLNAMNKDFISWHDGGLHTLSWGGNVRVIISKNPWI